MGTGVIKYNKSMKYMSKLIHKYAPKYDLFVLKYELTLGFGIIGHTKTQIHVFYVFFYFFLFLFFFWFNKSQSLFFLAVIWDSHCNWLETCDPIFFFFELSFCF